MTVSDAELVSAIESTLFLYPPIAGQFQDLGIPGIRGRLTKISHPLTNLAGDARFSEREADAMIRRVQDRYGSMAFGWVTGPSTRPFDLPDRLAAAGVAREESLAGMAVTDLGLAISTDPAVRVEEVSFRDALAESDMMARAYGLPLEVARFFNEVLAASATQIKARGYFGYRGSGEPVAWSFLVYLPDSPIVLLGGAATLPEHRGHGLYTALVARRLADARTDGRTAAVIQADRATSAPICAKLGFRELCALEVFVRQATS